MKIVYICSPYRAKDGAELDRNIDYAQQLTRQALEAGLAPITPHLYMTQCMDDKKPEERARGMAAGLALLKGCDFVIAGVKYGITEGMDREIHTANMLGIAVIDANQIKRHLEYEEKRQERAASDYAKLHSCEFCKGSKLYSCTGYDCREPYRRAYEYALKDSAGYGLAQWTYWSRKQALLNHAKQAGVSIADLNMQLGFLWEELQGYTAVMDALKKAGSVRAASDAVLTGYEKPADQSETVKKKRAEYGEGYYKKYAAGNGTKYYRVRKSWTDAASQLGAFTSLENAKSACKAGYTVYDDNGKAVYTAAGQQASAGVPFSVQVDILDLNIRTGAGTNYAKTGEKTGKGVFTIVEVKAGQGASAGWGRLKSGAGWISLDYATRLA